MVSLAVTNPPPPPLARSFLPFDFPWVFAGVFHFALEFTSRLALIYAPLMIVLWALNMPHADFRLSLSRSKVIVQQQHLYRASGRVCGETSLSLLFNFLFPLHLFFALVPFIPLLRFSFIYFFYYHYFSLSLSARALCQFHFCKVVALASIYLFLSLPMAYSWLFAVVIYSIIRLSFYFLLFFFF